MSGTPTIPTEPTAASDPKPTGAPPDDSGVWDMERGMRLIKVLRGVESQLTKENNWLRNSLQAVAGGRPLTPEQEAAVTYVTPTNTAATVPTGDDPSTLATLAAILGVDASDTAAMLEQGKQIRLSQELGDLFHTLGLDVSLSRAAINDAHLLSGVDVGAPDLHNTLENIVTGLVAKHPQLRLRANVPPTSMVPMPAGSGGAGPAPLVTRESLKFLDSATIDKLRTSGQLRHLDVGSG